MFVKLAQGHLCQAMIGQVISGHNPQIRLLLHHLSNQNVQKGQQDCGKEICLARQFLNWMCFLNSHRFDGCTPFHFLSFSCPSMCLYKPRIVLGSTFMVKNVYLQEILLHFLIVLTLNNCRTVGPREKVWRLAGPLGHELTPRPPSWTKDFSS